MGAWALGSSDSCHPAASGNGGCPGAGHRERGKQATKGVRWMPRCSEAMKDVGGCEKFRGGANQPLSRKCPNGETPCPSWGRTPTRVRREEGANQGRRDVSGP